MTFGPLSGRLSGTFNQQLNCGENKRSVVESCEECLRSLKYKQVLHKVVPS